MTHDRFVELFNKFDMYLYKPNKILMSILIFLNSTIIFFSFCFTVFTIEKHTMSSTISNVCSYDLCDRNCDFVSTLNGGFYMNKTNMQT